MGFFDLAIGDSDFGPVELSQAARNLHMQVVGLSGQGKSYFLEHMIRQDILSGAGVCVIDPHGDMYDHLVDWMATKGLHTSRKVHLIHLAKGKWSVGFNPLARGDAAVGTRVGAFLDACQVVWRDDESAGHKTLANLLWMVFTTLAHHRLSVREAPLLANAAYKEHRRKLVAATGNQTLIDAWAEVDEWDKNFRASQFVAVNNRLRALVGTPVIQSMLGKTQHLLDFKTCMRRGDVVLVNLAHEGEIEPQSAQILGALITADMYYSAFGRDEAEAASQPFYAYIDECSEFLNPKIVKALDQTRKYGLHYILSHQRLDQLGDRRDDPIRKGVMGGTQNKVVFLQEDEGDTDELGALLFGKLFDFQRVKEDLARPTVVGYDVDILRGGSVSEGQNSGDVSGAGLGAGAFSSSPDIDGATPIVGASETSNEFTANSRGKSQATSESWSETLVPRLEERSFDTYSKEEQRHLAAVEIRKLQPRTGFIYRANDRQALKFTTPEILQIQPSDAQRDAFYEGVTALETCQLTADLEAEIVGRRALLTGPEDYPEDDEDQFRTEL